MERLSDATQAVTDPIRLVRMVKEIDPLRRSAHLVMHDSRDPIRLARMVNKMERLSDATQAVTDPIRLVRMVKEIDPLRRSAHLADESPSPTRRARWGQKRVCIAARRGRRR